MVAFKPQSESLQHLRSWQDTEDPGTRFNRVRVSVAVACLCALGAFFVVVGLPLSTPRTEFIAVGFTADAPSLHPETQTSAETLGTVDQWIAAANGFADSTDNGWIATYWSANGASNSLQDNTTFAKTQIVYCAGVLDIQGDELHLYESADHALDAKRGMLLKPLLRKLAKRSESTVVLLDLRLDPHLITGLLPEWTRFRTQQILDGTASTVDDAHLSFICNFTHPISDHDAGTHAPSIAFSMRHVFAVANDNNKDRLISLSELNSALQHELAGSYVGVNCPSPKGDVTRRAAMLPNPILFPLASVPKSLAKKELEEKKPSASTNEPQATLAATSSDGNSTTAGHAQHKLPVVAPTMTLAANWRQLGVESDSSELAVLALDELNTLAQRPLGTEQAETWLAKDRSNYPNWILLQRCDEVLRSRLDWSLKRRLVQSQLAFHRLSLRTDLHNTEREQYRLLQGKLLDIQRKVAAPVRADHERFMTTVIPQLHQELAAFEARVAARDDAKKLAMRLIEQPGILLDYRIAATSDRTDPVLEVIELIIQHVTIEPAMGLPSTPDQEEASEQSVHRMRSIAEKLLTASRHGPIQQTDDFVDAKNVNAVTDIRLRRLAAWQRLARSTFPQSGEVTEAPHTVHCREMIEQHGLSSSQAVHALQQLQVEWRRLLRSTSHAFLAWRSEGRHNATIDSSDSAWAMAAEQSAAVLDVLQASSWDATASELLLLSALQKRSVKICEAAGHPLHPPAMIDRYYRTELINGLDSSANSELIVTAPHAEDRDANQSPVRLSLEFDPALFRVTPLTAEAGRVAFTAPDPSFYARQFGSGLPKTPNSPSSRQNENNAPKSLVSEASLRFQIHRLEPSAFDAGLSLRVASGDRVTRTVIRLETYHPPFAELVDPHWELRPNDSSTRSIELRCLQSEPHTFSLRLLAVKTAQPIPIAPQPTQVASNWIEQNGGAAVLADKAEVTLTPNQISSIAFPASKPKPGVPPIMLSCLLLELSDSKTGLTQWLPIRPRVRRPLSLLAPVVDYDHQNEKIQIQLATADTANEPSSLEGLRVFIDVFELDTKKSIAKHSTTLTGDGTHTIELSSAALRASAGGIRIEINDWPNAFLYTFRKNHSERSLTLSDELVGVTFVSEDRTLYTQPEGAPAVVAAAAVIADGLFQYGSDTFRVGVDVNGNRELTEHSLAVHDTPVLVQFEWEGVSPKGLLRVRNTTAPQRFAIPIDLLQPGRYGLIAEMHHGNQVVWNVGPEIVIDGQKPVVAKLDILSPLPAILGAPVLCSVVIDDQGLSGPASVEAAWAIHGDLSLSPPVKPVSGQLLGDGIWKVQLPTSALVEGTHQLLVQCVDRAGNVSDLKVVSLEVLTKETLAARAAAQTTAVQGVIHYVTQPVPNFSVTLEASNGENINENSQTSQISQTKANDGPDTSRKILATVKTTAQGRFTFPKVRAGKYILRASGLYRGNHHDEAIEIQVSPPTPTSLPPIRID